MWPKKHFFSLKFIHYHVIGTETKKTIQLLLKTDLTVGNEYHIICPQKVNYDIIGDAKPILF